MAAPLHSLLRSGDSDEGQKKDDSVTSVPGPGLHTPVSLCHPLSPVPAASWASWRPLLPRSLLQLYPDPPRSPAALAGLTRGQSKPPGW